MRVLQRFVALILLLLIFILLAVLLWGGYGIYRDLTHKGGDDGR